MSEELEPVRQLPDPDTGEMLPATPDNAARIWLLARDVIRQFEGLQHKCDEVLGWAAEEQGTKTLYLDDYKVTLTGGMTVEYDPRELMTGLMERGCPPEIVEEAVKVSYRVDVRRVQRLAAANPEYAEAIEAASSRKEKRWRATVKKP